MLKSCFFINGNILKFSESKPVCCDVHQVLTLAKGLTHAAPFFRCPTCIKNMLSVFCQLTCSPDQLDFVANFTRESSKYFLIDFINGNFPHPPHFVMLASKTYICTDFTVYLNSNENNQ